MFKQTLVSILIGACFLILIPSAVAADFKATANGRTRTWLENVAVKDGTTTMQFKADGRIGVDLSVKSDGWTVGIFQDMDLDSDEGKASPTIGEQYVNVGTDNVGVQLGHFSPYGVTKGMTYAIGPISDSASYWVGENLPTTDLTDHLTVELKNVGLVAIVGLNKYGTDSADNYSETVLGAAYGKEFGTLDLGVEAISASTRIDEKDVNAAPADGEFDGKAFSMLALGIGYGLSDTMGVAFNYEGATTASGDDSVDDVKTRIMEVWFDLSLDDVSGISVGYGMKTTDDGTSEKTLGTLTSLNYLRELGIAGIFVNYLIATEKDDDGTPSAPAVIDSTTTTLAAGLEVNF